LPNRYITGHINKKFINNPMIDTSELDSEMEWLLSNLTFLEYVEKQLLP